MRMNIDIAVHRSPKNLNTGVWYRRNWKIYSCRRPSHWRPRESCMEPRAFFSHHRLGCLPLLRGPWLLSLKLSRGRLFCPLSRASARWKGNTKPRFSQQSSLTFCIEEQVESDFCKVRICHNSFMWTFSLSARRLTLSLVSGVLLHCSPLSNSELFHHRDYNCSLPATFNELRKLRRVKSQQCKLKLFCFWCVCSSYQLTFYEVKRYNYCFMLPARWMVLNLVSKASKPLCNIYVFDIFKRFCVINFHWLQNQEGFDCRTLHLFCYCLDIN